MTRGLLGEETHRLSPGFYRIGGRLLDVQCGVPFTAQWVCMDREMCGTARRREVNPIKASCQSLADGLGLRSSSRRVHERDNGTTNTTRWSPIYMSLRSLKNFAPARDHRPGACMKARLASIPSSKPWAECYGTPYLQCSHEVIQPRLSRFGRCSICVRFRQRSRQGTASDPRYKSRPPTALRLCTGSHSLLRPSRSHNGLQASGVEDIQTVSLPMCCVLRYLGSY